MSRRKAVVVGGSIGGLFAAHFMRSIGWDVTVYERASSVLAARGAGLAAREELLGLLGELRIAFNGDVGTEICSKVCLDISGKTACEILSRSLSSAWDRVYTALRASWPDSQYLASMTLRDLRQTASNVCARFDEGKQAEADILIAADGIRSAVRNQLLPECKPRYAGYVAWRGIATLSALPREFAHLLGRHMVFFFPAGEQVFSAPMPSAIGGELRLQYVWFRPTAEVEITSICTDAEGFCHRDGIPPSLIRRELVAQLHRDAREVLPPQLAAVVTAVEFPLFQPIYDLEVHQMAIGRVAMLGDAAFVARPHVGAGATKAGVDAKALANFLAADGADVELTLQKYSQQRVPFGRGLVERARAIGGHIGRAIPEQSWGSIIRQIGPDGLVDGRSGVLG